MKTLQACSEALVVVSTETLGVWTLQGKTRKIIDWKSETPSSLFQPILPDSVCSTYRCDSVARTQNALIMHEVVLWYASMNYLTCRLTWFSAASSPLSLGIFSASPPIERSISKCEISSQSSIFFSEPSSLNNLGLSGFLSLALFSLPQVFLLLYRLSPFKLHPCVLCGFPLPLPLCARLRGIRRLLSDRPLMRSRRTRQTTGLWSSWCFLACYCSPHTHTNSLALFFFFLFLSKAILSFFSLT